MARALADPRGAAEGAGAKALERRALVGVGLLDEQVVADELVVVLRVGDRRVEQLLEVPRDRRAGVCRGRRGPPRPTCRGCARSRAAPCARTSARTWPAPARPAAPASWLRPAPGERGWARRCRASGRRPCAVGSARARRASPSPWRRLPVLRLGLLPRRPGFVSPLPSPAPASPPALRRPRLACALGLLVLLRALSLLVASAASSPGPSSLSFWRSTAIALPPGRSRRARGRCASARTPRACDRPSTR